MPSPVPTREGGGRECMSVPQLGRRAARRLGWSRRWADRARHVAKHALETQPKRRRVGPARRGARAAACRRVRHEQPRRPSRLAWYSSAAPVVRVVGEDVPRLGGARRAAVLGGVLGCRELDQLRGRFPATQRSRTRWPWHEDARRHHRDFFLPAHVAAALSDRGMREMPRAFPARALGGGSACSFFRPSGRSTARETSKRQAIRPGYQLIGSGAGTGSPPTTRAAMPATCFSSWSRMASAAGLAGCQ